MKPDVQQAKQKAVKELLYPHYLESVIGVGIGEKAGNECLRIYVVAKTAKALVPGGFLGFPTDLVEIGPLGRRGREPWIKPLRRTGTKPGATTGTNPFPPTVPGSRIRVKTSAPNVNSGAIGTLGAMVVDRAGKRYILGCNHILAVNGRVPGDLDAEIVSAVFVGKEQAIAGPVVYFVGDEKKVASPVVYVPLTRYGDNVADCALAQINEHKKVLAKFPESMGRLNPAPGKPEIHRKVQKVGAATDHTTGTIIDTLTDLYVDTSFGTFRFKDQIVIDGGKDEFATEGDSGSIVWDEGSKQPVAMVFAAAGRYAIACPLSAVVGSLKKKIGQELEIVIS